LRKELGLLEEPMEPVEVLRGIKIDKGEDASVLQFGPLVTVIPDNDVLDKQRKAVEAYRRIMNWDEKTRDELVAGIISITIGKGGDSAIIIKEKVITLQDKIKEIINAPMHHMTKLTILRGYLTELVELQDRLAAHGEVFVKHRASNVLGNFAFHDNKVKLLDVPNCEYTRFNRKLGHLTPEQRAKFISLLEEDIIGLEGLSDNQKLDLIHHLEKKFQGEVGSINIGLMTGIVLAGIGALLIPLAGILSGAGVIVLGAIIALFGDKIFSRVQQVITKEGAIEKTIFTEEKQVESALKPAVEAIAGLSTGGDKSALMLRDILDKSHKAITGAQLFEQNNPEALGKFYNKAVIDILKEFIAVRGNRGPPLDVSNPNLNLASILHNTYILLTNEAELNKTYTQDKLICAINNALERAVMTDVGDRVYREFANEVVKTKGIKQWILLWRIGLGGPTGYLKFLLAKIEKDEELQKNMIVGALDGNRISPMHCGVRSSAALMNNNENQQDLETYLDKIRLALFKSKLNQEGKVTFEVVAFEFSNRVIDIVKNPGAERNKGINIRKFLSNLSKGDISDFFIHIVLRDAFGVPTTAVNVPAERLSAAGRNLVIANLEAKNLAGKNASHFVGLESNYVTETGEPAVRIDDNLYGSFGVTEENFLKHFKPGKGVNVLGLGVGGSILNIGGRVLTPEMLNGINGSAYVDVAVLWKDEERIPLNRITYGNIEETGRPIRPASLTSVLPPQEKTDKGALAFAKKQDIKGGTREFIQNIREIFRRQVKLAHVFLVEWYIRFNNQTYDLLGSIYGNLGKRWDESNIVGYVMMLPAIAVYIVIGGGANFGIPVSLAIFSFALLGNIGLYELTRQGRRLRQALDRISGESEKFSFIGAVTAGGVGAVFMAGAIYLSFLLVPALGIIGGVIGLIGLTAATMATVNQLSLAIRIWWAVHSGKLTAPPQEWINRTIEELRKELPEEFKTLPIVFSAPQENKHTPADVKKDANGKPTELVINLQRLYSLSSKPDVSARIVRSILHHHEISHIRGFGEIAAYFKQSLSSLQFYSQALYGIRRQDSSIVWKALSGKLKAITPLFVVGIVLAAIYIVGTQVLPHFVSLDLNNLSNFTQWRAYVGKVFLENISYAYLIIGAASIFAWYKFWSLRSAGKPGWHWLALTGLLAFGAYHSIPATATVIAGMAMIVVYTMNILTVVWGVVLGGKIIKSLAPEKIWTKATLLYQHKSGEEPTHEIDCRELRLFGIVIRDVIDNKPLIQGLSKLARRDMEQAVANGKGIIVKLTDKDGREKLITEHKRFEQLHPHVCTFIRYTPIIAGLLSVLFALTSTAGLVVAIGFTVFLLILKWVGVMDEVYEMMVNLSSRNPEAPWFLHLILIPVSFFHGLYRVMHGFALVQFTSRVYEGASLSKMAVAPFAAMKDILQGRSKLAVASGFGNNEI